MNKKKGFTLIELLAVIVILAVIALIVTPIVTNIIGKTKKSAAERSTEGYVKSVNYAAQKYQTEHDGEVPTSFEQIKDTVEASATPTNILSVTLDPKTGEVTRIVLRINNSYNCVFNNNETSCEIGKELKEIEIGGELWVQYEEGMTWEQYVNSKYCNGLEVNTLYSTPAIRYAYGLITPEPEKAFITTNGSNVKPTDVISSTADYKFDTYKCFVAGTKVLTNKGLINIEDIKVGDYVYSYNEETKTYSYNIVSLTHKNEVTKDKTTLTINGEEITSTSNHSYYTNNRGWVGAKDLTLADEIVFSDGTIGHVSNIKTIKSNEKYTVYNLTVENSHTYFVGENKVLVHNAPDPVGGGC